MSKRKIGRKRAFLVYNSGKLIISTSKHNIGRGLTVGWKPPLALFLTISGNFTATKKPILEQGEICSIYGAVRLLADSPRFPNRGYDSYKTTPEGMASITAALTFLHMMLTGRVKPAGMFKSDVPPGWPGSQKVKFNLPVPYGIAYSTHALGFEPGPGIRSVYRHNFCRVGKDRWDTSCNYSIPAIIGGHSTTSRYAYCSLGSSHSFRSSQEYGNYNLLGERLSEALGVKDARAELESKKDRIISG